MQTSKSKSFSPLTLSQTEYDIHSDVTFECYTQIINEWQDLFCKNNSVSELLEVRPSFQLWLDHESLIVKKKKKKKIQLTSKFNR